MFILVHHKNGDQSYLPSDCLSSLTTVVEDFDDIVGLRYVSLYKHNREIQKCTPSNEYTLGENLKMLRKDRKLTQQAVVAGVKFKGISQGPLSKWERSDQLPLFDQLLSLLDYYGVLPETYELMTDLWKKEKQDASNQ